MFNLIRNVRSIYKSFFVTKELPLHKLAYSQEGEDIILSRIFKNKKTGFYVDVGAHNPQRFSNTYYFYSLGWRGINIDAMPKSMDAFNKTRPLDINLEIAISKTAAEMTYYAFNDPALNTFSKQLADEYLKGGYRIIFEKKIATRSLADVLTEHLPAGQEIDFLNIDVEGLDYQVTLSNDWLKYRPRVVLIEVLNTQSIEQALESEVAQFMNSQDYQLYCKAINTLLFKDKSIQF